MSRLPDTYVWYKTYRLRNDARFSYRIAANDPLTLLTEQTTEERNRRIAAFKADPLNPKHYASRNGDSSVVELRAAPPQAFIERRAGIPEEKVEKLTFKSRTLKNEREIWVYTPPGYRPDKQAYNLLVTLDGETYVDGVPAHTILDNLIAEGKLPPTVAVMVGNADGARLQELWHYEPFAEFIAVELIPWIRERYRVTSRVDETAIAGSSLSGGAAVHIALRHPEIFGNVLAQSGGFMYRQRRSASVGTRYPGELLEENFPESEWLARQFALSPRLPLRFYLEAGLLEDVIYRESPPRYAVPSLLLATRHLRDVLQAKGYAVCYREYNGAHETLSWRGTFGDGLTALLGKGCVN
ncbi:MAG TPA: alpha/beta hydrolase-fold protein [Pyrinomonadaceae bacterium]|jgi:enterochelin esterase family protein